MSSYHGQQSRRGSVCHCARCEGHGPDEPDDITDEERAKQKDDEEAQAAERKLDRLERRLARYDND